jgi:pullulanase/glycogen debranching enzyme
MRTHTNALEAMLLYMNDTWNDLAANEDVQFALNSKLATQTELLAAGYNSNAAKLPQYLRRGGASWRVLIPRETQMYLQIYKNFETLVPIKQRSPKAS